MRDIPRADHEVEFIGGSLALDFANTLGGMHTAPTHEHIVEYSDLVEFCRLAGTISPSQGRRLIEEAGRQPARAAACFAARSRCGRRSGASSTPTRRTRAPSQSISRPSTRKSSPRFGTRDFNRARPRSTTPGRTSLCWTGRSGPSPAPPRTCAGRRTTSVACVSVAPRPASGSSSIGVAITRVDGAT